MILKKDIGQEYRPATSTAKGAIFYLSLDEDSFYPMKRRKVYDREFKENTVKLSYERDNLTQFARKLGISVKQLYSWRSQYRAKGSESFSRQWQYSSQ